MKKSGSIKPDAGVIDGRAEVVTNPAAVDLGALATSINAQIDLIAGHEAAFEDATLEPRLLIGLEIAKAQEVFGLSISEAASLGGIAKAAELRRDSAENSLVTSGPGGFAGWLKSNCDRLGKPRAYKYAHAFRALGLTTAEASPKAITAAVKTLRHRAGRDGQPMPTVESLYRLGKPAKSAQPPVIEAPKDSKQLRLEDAREALQRIEDACEKFVSLGQLDDLDKPGLEKAKEFNLRFRDQIAARLR